MIFRRVGSSTAAAGAARVATSSATRRRRRFRCAERRWHGTVYGVDGDTVLRSHAGVVYAAWRVRSDAEVQGRSGCRSAPHGGGCGHRAGRGVRDALGDKKGIMRAGYFVMAMDETLAVAAVDLSGRVAYVVDDQVNGAGGWGFSDGVGGGFLRWICARREGECACEDDVRAQQSSQD